MIGASASAELLRLVGAVTRQQAELEHLRAFVVARLVTPDDLDTITLLLPALWQLRRHALVTSGELVALAPVAAGEAGVMLRRALERFDHANDPAKALGWCLKRTSGLPVGAMFLRRIEAARSRDPALYCVGFLDPETRL